MFFAPSILTTDQVSSSPNAAIDTHIAYTVDTVLILQLPNPGFHKSTWNYSQRVEFMPHQTKTICSQSIFQFSKLLLTQEWLLSSHSNIRPDCSAEFRPDEQRYRDGFLLIRFCHLGTEAPVILLSFLLFSFLSKVLLPGLLLLACCIISLLGQDK